MLLNINDFKARLKGNTPEGWYIMTGDEDYLKKYYSRELEAAVLPYGKSDIFNYAEWCGQDMELAAVTEAIQSPPMMQDYKLIEWRFANLNSLGEKDIKAFREKLFPLKKEFPSAVFLITTTEGGFDTGTEKKPTSLMKALSAVFDVMIFPKSTDVQLLSWLKKHFDAEGISVTPDALNVMLARVGHSMELLHSEVEKLSAFLHQNGQTALTAEAVEFVTTTNIENESFALQNSIYEGNIKKAFRVLADMKSKRTDPQYIIASLAKIYSTLSSVAMLTEEGVSNEEIARLTKLASYPLQLNQRAVRKLGTKRINQALKSLLEKDASAKAGGISDYQAIELFIMENI